MIRAVILAATIALIVVGYREQPKPVASVEVKYCPISYWTPDPFTGKRHWYESYGLCSEMDRYENA